MRVKKGSRTLLIDESEKDTYLSQGYDLVELDKETKSYKVVEEATGGKTYSIAEYKAISDALKQAKETIKELESKVNDGGKFDRKAALERLTELGVEHKGNASNDELKKMLEENA